MGPTLVVFQVESEQGTVTATTHQKDRMVLITVINIVISTETFIALIIIVISGTTSPTVTLNAKMVITLTSQFTITCTRLQHSLCQRDTGGNAMFLHLFDGEILVAVEIFLIACVPLDLCHRRKRQHQQESHSNADSSHV